MAGQEREYLFARNQTAVRYNPFGVFDEARFGLRHHPDENDDRRFWSIAANASTSPAFARTGIFVEYQPASFINLSAIYEGGAYFGTFGAVAPKASRREVGVGAVDQPRSSWTHQAILGASFVAQRRPIMFRTNNRLVFQGISAGAANAVFYDPNWDIVFRNNGFVYVNDVDLFFELSRSTRLGARYNITQALDDSGDTSRGQRVGPALSAVLSRDPSSVFRAPTLSVVVNWWLERAYRSAPLGAAVSPFVPFVGVAFSFRIEPPVHQERSR